MISSADPQMKQNKRMSVGGRRRMRKLKQLILLKYGVFVKKITVLCTVAIYWMTFLGGLPQNMSCSVGKLF